MLPGCCRPDWRSLRGSQIRHVRCCRNPRRLVERPTPIELENDVTVVENFDNTIAVEVKPTVILVTPLGGFVENVATGNVDDGVGVLTGKTEIDKNLI